MQAPLFPLDDKYRFVRWLGVGGFGHVWQAEDVLLGRHVAVKQIRSDLLSRQDLLIDEMEHLSSLDHPHIVKFLHHFHNNELLFLVMEYCSGGSLDADVGGRPQAPVTVFEWGRTLAETLAAVHRIGIVHHDIKPQNLLLTEDRRLKIADFGVANRNWGTRAYMAPEISLGEALDSDPRIDVYALGITLLELLLGNNPLRAFDGRALLREKIRHAFIPTTLDRWVQELLLKATHPTPELRFQSMVEFREAIESRHVPHVFNGDRIKAHRLAEQAKVLLARKKWVAAYKSCQVALRVAPDCVAALVVAGRLELMLKHIDQARGCFAMAVSISPRVALQKELGWIALEEGNFPNAISMLTDHLQREPADFDACNLLLQCFYLTERYELGRQLAETVIAQKETNDCFENNAFLCRILNEDYSPEALEAYQQRSIINPFLEFNVKVVTESPRSWGRDSGPSLKSKLLFQEYRFGSLEKRRTARSMFLDCGDGHVFSSPTPLITLGRLETNTIPLDQGGVSRRHAVIVNYPDDVWCYDLGSVMGIMVDGHPVCGKAHLDGVHVVDIGTCRIKLATAEGLLI